MVEINWSHYATAKRRASLGYESRCIANLWKDFAHERNATQDDEKLFKQEGI